MQARRAVLQKAVQYAFSDNAFFPMTYVRKSSSAITAPRWRGGHRIVSVEGFQGQVETISSQTARRLLFDAMRHGDEVPAVQGTQGIFCQYHTSSAEKASTKTSEHDVDSDFSDVSSPQGVQGDDCAHFQVWLASCRRYGLGNCDEQLQGIQTGRKTLSQVLAEQDEQIRAIAESYHQRARNEGASFQGLQADGQFPSIDTPCPQGIQGDDCVRFKLWLENCHKFGFQDCMDQLQGMQQGRKTLAEIFAEQDALIRSIVQQHQQRRSYMTSSARPAEASGGGQTAE